MDLPEIPSGRSPKRELQGPRPSPLRVSKDSHKIRKPPVPPHTQQQQHHHQQFHAQPRPPVIIYAVSPKIIHAEPNEFMSLVQRLTGPSALSSSFVIPAPSGYTSQPSSSISFHDASGAISPAARFASIEKTRSPKAKGHHHQPVLDENLEFVEGLEAVAADIERCGQFPGILSPNPNLLPPIPRNIFSPPSDSANPFNFFNDFSPILLSARNNHLEDINNFNVFPSPSPFFSPQINMNSPSTLSFFRSLFDL